MRFSKSFLFTLCLLAGVAQAAIVYPPSGGGGAPQTPWAQNINGAGFHTFNATMFDNGINGVVDKSVDPVKHVLWSGASVAGNGKCIFDFTGNGGGGAVTSPCYMIADTGVQNIAVFKPFADHNYNVSIDVDNRTWTDLGGVISIDAQGRALIGFNNDLIIDYGGAGLSGAHLSFTPTQAGFNVDILMQGHGIDMGFGAITNAEVTADNVTAAHFFGDGNSITNIPAAAVVGLASIAISGSYGDLSGAPIDGGGNWQQNMSSNGHSLTMNDQLNINSDIVSNSSTGVTVTMTTAVCGTQNGQIQFAHGIAIYTQDCIP